MGKVKRKGSGTEMPPEWLHVSIYFQQKGMSEETANAFYNFYNTLNWHTEKGQPIRNWKTLACEHIWQLAHPST